MIGPSRCSSTAVLFSSVADDDLVVLVGHGLAGVTVVVRPVGGTRAITRLWENARSEFVPFLDYDVEVRRVICSTNAIESLHARQGQGQRPFPHRAGGPEMPVRGHPGTGPTGKGRA